MLTTELSADARAVADVLIATPVGELASLPALSAAIGRDITACRHVLATARRVAEREAGAVFACEPRAGYRRVSAEAAAQVVGGAARGHIRRAARRARRSIVEATKRANDLTPEAMRRASAEITVLGMMEHLSRDAVALPKADAPAKPEPVAIAARRLFGIADGPAA
jgi:hypothetical protein